MNEINTQKASGGEAGGEEPQDWELSSTYCEANRRRYDHSSYLTCAGFLSFIKGGFSYVFLAKDHHNKHYALKRVLTHDDEELQHVKQEAAVMVFNFRIIHIYTYFTISFNRNKLLQ